MIVSIDNRIPVPDSYAAVRTLGLYNVEPEDAMRFRLDVDVPMERDDWQIGIIVGPSGSGKSSILRELATQGWIEFQAGWDPGLPIIEPLSWESYAQATASLSAVGLASVPSWLRPREVLSMGEGFRADMAQLLIAADDSDERMMIDEFTSVLDRQVAKVAAGAFAKAWRKRPGRRLILFTPHYDILDWVQPDWWIDTAEGADQFAHDRGVIVARKGDFQEARHHGGYRRNRVGSVEC